LEVSGFRQEFVCQRGLRRVYEISNFGGWVFGTIEIVHFRIVAVYIWKHPVFARNAYVSAACAAYARVQIFVGGSFGTIEIVPLRTEKAGGVAGAGF
jgi:hypothetical protein